MVENQKRIGAQGELGVCTALIVTELDFEHTIIELLDHGAHLPTNKPMLGHVHQQGDDVENVDGSVGRHRRKPQRR